MTTAPTFVARDFIKLRSTALLALVLISIASGLVYWELKESAASRSALRQAEARHQEIDRKLRRVNDEEAEIKAKSTLFRQLEARHIVGPEQRLNWIETLHAIRDRRQLFSIDYEIAPQKPLGAPAGGYQFASSNMAFRLPLLHELDLTGLLADLRQQAPAVVHIERCLIERASAGAEPASRGVIPLLTAQCTLRWITLYDTRGGAAK